MAENPPIYDTTIEQQFHRIYRATGCCTQGELAALLGIRQSSVAVAKRQGKIPDKWLIKFYQLGISPEWILTGEECVTDNAPLGAAQLPDKVILKNILYCFPLEDLLAEIQRRKGATH